MAARMKKVLDSLYCVDTTPKEITGFTSAYILVSQENRAVIVEPGPSRGAGDLMEAIERLGVDPVYVVPTHVHLDHAGATAKLLERFPGAKVLVHPKGVPHLVEPEKLWIRTKLALGDFAEYIGAADPAPSERVLATEDGQRVVLDDLELVVLHTPGHASHHQVVWWPSRRVVFPGDAVNMVFKHVEVHVPATPPPFKRDPYLRSFQRVKKLNPEVLALTHFGVHASAQRLLDKLEEQLKLWLKTVEEEVLQGVKEVDAVYEKIAEVDHNAAQAEGYIRALAKLSVKGMIQDLLGGHG
ncbi:MAG: MBL fold metallo-hydrolase [Candidatus Verstraetearchaeota archaeon]|nr:MBL fold metallo-hydrolase [Candidatus Verstraetearchaeota archaeon]